MARAYPICSSKAEPLRIARRSVMRGTIYPRIRGPGRCSPTAPPGWSSRDLGGRSPPRVAGSRLARLVALLGPVDPVGGLAVVLDRKSTRLNSSHVKISYAVFCLKKKISLLPDEKGFIDFYDICSYLIRLCI